MEPDHDRPKGEVPRWLMTFEEELDKKVIVVLRDGAKITGYLRSFDQFGSIVLEDAYEMRVVEMKYSELYLGPMIIRGENILLFGEVNTEKDFQLERVPLHEIFKLEETLGISSDDVEEF